MNMQPSPVKIYETERKRVVMCDYDVNNIGFYLPDGSYEPIYDPVNDFSRLIREHICDAAEISFRKSLKDYVYREDLLQDDLFFSCSDAIGRIKAMLSCCEPDIGSIEKELAELEKTIANYEEYIYQLLAEGLE